MPTQNQIKRMSKQRRADYLRLYTELSFYDVTEAELNTLLRAERMLRRWAEQECNGDIVRDEETGTPMRYLGSWSLGPHDPVTKRFCCISDLETATLKRVRTILEPHGLDFYHQTDPRGCSLYVLRPGDVPPGENIAAYYNRGVAVCFD